MSYPRITELPTGDDLCWSTDEENFSHDSFADAVDWLRVRGTLEVSAPIWVGRKVHPDISELVSADSVIDDIINRASDEGEYADDWADSVDPSEEAKKELDELLEAWAEKHLPALSWWRVEGVHEYRLTAEDLGDKPNA